MKQSISAKGKLEVVHSFRFAPEYEFYIMYFGFPDFGIGFCPKKMDFLIQLLIDNDVDPHVYHDEQDMFKRNECPDSDSDSDSEGGGIGC